MSYLKDAAEVVYEKRKTDPVHGLMDKLVFGKNELAAPGTADLENFRRIAQYMTAARPHQLETAKVLSGRVDPAELVQQIKRHQHYDTFIEDLFSDRDSLAMSFSDINPTLMEQLPPLYFPHANSAVMNQNSPGALIHELGHGVDLAKQPGESNFRRYLRWRLKPELWAELSAWKKGRKAYQKGFAASDEVNDPKAREEYATNMQSYNARKYPAYGTYLGGAAGGLLGMGIPAAIAYAMNPRISPDLLALLIGAGGTLGGLGGAFSGALGGSWWAGAREEANKARALRQLEKVRESGDLDKVRAKLQELRRKAEDTKKKKQTGKNPAKKKSN